MLKNIPIATIVLKKISWKRDNSYPPGKPAPGVFNCPCGNDIIANFKEGDNVECLNCEALYTWDGWVINPGVNKTIKELE